MARAGLLLMLAFSPLASGACHRAAEESARRVNEEFQHEVREAARLPRAIHTDDRIRQILMKRAFERGLAPFIAERQFVIQTTEQRRKISCEYEHTVEVAPGRTKALRFEIEVDEPLNW